MLSRLKPSAVHGENYFLSGCMALTRPLKKRGKENIYDIHLLSVQ